MKKIHIPVNKQRVEKEERQYRINSRVKDNKTNPTNKDILDAILDLTMEVRELIEKDSNT